MKTVSQRLNGQPQKELLDAALTTLHARTLDDDPERCKDEHQLVSLAGNLFKGSLHSFKSCTACPMLKYCALINSYTSTAR